MHQPNKKLQKQTKPWYKKWWGITAIVVFGLIAIGAAASDNQSTKTNKDGTDIAATEPTRQRDPAELKVDVSHDNLNVIITNNESKDLGNCNLKLNNDYTYSAANRYLVNAGQEVKIGLSNFTKGDGTRFNVYQTKPQYLRIDCNRKDGDSGSADIFWE